MKSRIFTAVAAVAFVCLPAFALAETRVTTNTSFQVEGKLLPAEPCPIDHDGQLALQIGEARLSLPNGSVAVLLPAEIPRVSQKDGGPLEMTLPPLAGCPETPLRTSMAIIAPSAELPPGMMLTEVAPREGLSNTARGLLSLRDGGTCASQDAGLMRCEGSQTINGQRVPVVYLLAEDPVETIASGAPLYAVCWPKAKLECEIADDLEGRIAFRMMLPTGTPDLTQLKDARARAMAFLAGIRQEP